jgi:lactoylglutathione lyase
MRLNETGFVLTVSNYPECLIFYRDRLGLRIRKQKEHLACFDFGGGYLLVEAHDPSMPKAPVPLDGPSFLRMNVEDIEAAAGELRAQGVPVERYDCDWGMIGVFHDPAGNRIELCKWL